MKASAPLRAACLALLACASATGPAMGQGAVFSGDGRLLEVRRVRALLVFQDRGQMDYRTSEPNRQDLILELELAAPAPAGSTWVLACPAEGAAVLAYQTGALDELAALWRRETGEDGPDAWPEREGPLLRPEFSGPLAGAALDELFAGKPGASGYRLPEVRGRPEWAAFTAEVPAGTRRLGPVRLTCQPLAAVYPGAIGARDVGEGRWELPPLELALLHSHFVNIDDNRYGLASGFGLKPAHRDAGTLQEGSPLWHVPKRAYPGEPLKPGRIRGNAGELPATAALIQSCGALDSLFLTVLTGRPGYASRAGLDLTVYSHYPSAVERVGTGRGVIALAVTLLVLVILATFLLKRKEIADEP